MQQTQADDLVMSLTEQALARPKEEREAYLLGACNGDADLFKQVWNYTGWEERMGNFLLQPFIPVADDSLPFEPGQVLINRFRIVREVAQGGMGIVWEAVDEKLGRRVAIKCAKAGFGKRLPPEVNNAREISHRNVCRIFEIHTASTVGGDIDFLSMEFVEGETLSERLRSVALPKHKCASIARQLCAGLEEAHRNGVIHGDFKSGNVILAAGPDGSLRAVIMDFGLARRPSGTGEASATEVFAGTPAYMAPELWKGGKPSVASDIYALGVVLWELVSGRPLSELGARSSSSSEEDHPAWKPPEGYGKWDRILAKCLDSDPGRRFQSAAEVARALGPSESERWFLTAAVAAFVALVSGLATYERATRPAETVRLSILPFAAAARSSELSKRLLTDTAGQLGQIHGNSRTKFVFIQMDKISRNGVDSEERARAVLGATHVLEGVLEEHSGRTTVRAYVMDLRSGTSAGEWDAEYEPGETRYAPVALAGLVADVLHLPPAQPAIVNAAARKDYVVGRSAIQNDSGVDAALEAFRRAVAEDPGSALTFAGLAEAQFFKYYSTDDHAWLERAKASLHKAEERQPDLAEVHDISGVLKASGGWYEQAVADYLRAIELEPEDGNAYRWLGEAYEGNNQVDEALAAFHKAVELDPHQYRNHGDLGFFYHQRAQYTEAVQHFRAALALAPNEFRLHYDLGVDLMNLGRFDQAEADLKASLRLHETADALQTLGLVMMFESKDLEAIGRFRRAAALGSERCQCWMNLGTAYRRAGLASQSERAYRRGFDLCETEMIRNPRKGMVRAHLAYLSAQLGDKRRAESEIAQALQQSPNDSDTRWLAAVTYEALGRRNDTLSVLADSPPGVLADVNLWPDVSALHQDPRFLRLLSSHSAK